jgi:peptidoglycan/LPS O-acetylase OafA/YrhL
MSAPNTAATNRFDALDFLRGVAILMVFLFHFYGHTYGQFRLPWHGNWPDWSSMPWRSFQWLYVLRLGGDGVWLFFVLSGFCIHYSTLQRRARGTWTGVGSFFWGRFFRIVPTYLIALAVFGMAFGLEGRLNLIAHLTLTHSLFPAREVFFAVNPSFWSLAVEWQLYLVYPLLLFLRVRAGPLALLAASIAGTLIFKYVVPVTAPFDWHRLPFLYWFQWGIGAYLADVWFHTGRPAFPNGLKLLAVLIPLWVMTNYYLPLSLQSRWITSTAAAVVVDQVLAAGTGSSWWYRTLGRLGLVSYSMYLLHQPLIEWTTRPVLELLGLPATPVVMFAVALPLSLGVVATLSAASYYALERTSIQLGHTLQAAWQRRRATDEPPR